MRDAKIHFDMVNISIVVSVTFFLVFRMYIKHLLSFKFFLLENYWKTRLTYTRIVHLVTKILIAYIVIDNGSKPPYISFLNGFYLIFDSF